MAKQEIYIISARTPPKPAAVWAERYARIMRESCKLTWSETVAKWWRSPLLMARAACQANVFRMQTCICLRACCSAKLLKHLDLHRWANSLWRLWGATHGSSVCSAKFTCGVDAAQSVKKCEETMQLLTVTSHNPYSRGLQPPKRQTRRM